MNLKSVIPLLKDDLSIAALIFRLSSEGTSQPDIHKHLVGMGYVISQEVVRKVLHREAPFTDDIFYAKVDPNHEKIAVGRFKTFGPRKAKAACPKANVPLLTAVLTARLEYERAITAAMDSGMKRESIEAWVDVVAVGDLS